MAQFGPIAPAADSDPGRLLRAGSDKDHKAGIKKEVQNTYEQIKDKVLKEVAVANAEQLLLLDLTESDRELFLADLLPPGLNKDNVKDDVSVSGSPPYLYRVNTYAFLYNETTVVARIGDSGYNRHFFTGSSLNTGMLSTLDLLTKCGSVRGTAQGHSEGYKGDRLEDNKWGAINQIKRGETQDVDPRHCDMELQVDNYNESQKTLHTLIPKEIDFLL